MNKKANPIYGIRAKLLSAVSMLLVAVIMVISSTYAWFTLSTAPEVKGIHTAIGANGALEMALTTGSGATFNAIQNGEVGTSATVVEKNGYWGNLVDISDAAYGSQSIVLLPSTLDVVDNKIPTGGAAILSTPKYGADGRVIETTQNAIPGTFKGGDKNAFIANDEYGFRGVGVSSSLTARELAYRNYKQNAMTAASSAKVEAAAALQAKGSDLANIVIKHGTAGGNDTYEVADIDNLLTMVTGLESAVAKVEKAYIDAIISYVAAKNYKVENAEAWSAITGYTSLENLINDFQTKAGVAFPDDVKTYTDKILETKANVTTAKTTLESLKTSAKESYTWAEIRDPLALLCDPDLMTINGHTVTWVKENVGTFATEAISNGIKVEMASGSGAFADIADHADNYSADILLNIDYNGTKLENFKARMITTSAITPKYLNGVNTLLSANDFYVADTEGSVEKPLSELYGYIIDLTFRTNAADSDLLLQTTPVDRIYKDNTVNELTYGAGSTMTFKSEATGFTADQLKSLMGCIRIVFFETETGTILANAKLDATNAVSNGDGYTASIYLYTINAESGEIVLEKDQADAKIQTLQQNAEERVSALVYLEGEELTNASVPANVAKSVSGTLNLQFSSSANLVPMNYGDYKTQGGAQSTTADTNA